MNRESIKFYAGVKTGNAVYFWLWADQLPPTNIDTRPELFKMAQLPSKGEGIRPAMAAELTRLCKKAAERANESAEEKDHYFLPPTAEVYHTLRRSFLEASFPRCVKLNESAAAEECQDRPLCTKAQAATNIRRALLSLDDNDIVAAAFIDAAAHGAPPGGNVESEGIAKTFEAMKGGGKKAAAQRDDNSAMWDSANRAARPLCYKPNKITGFPKNGPFVISQTNMRGKTTEWTARNIDDALSKIAEAHNDRGGSRAICDTFDSEKLKYKYGADFEDNAEIMDELACTKDEAVAIAAMLAAPCRNFYAAQSSLVLGAGEWAIIAAEDLENFKRECLHDEVWHDMRQAKIYAMERTG